MGYTVCSLQCMFIARYIHNNVCSLQYMFINNVCSLTYMFITIHVHLNTCSLVCVPICDDFMVFFIGADLIPKLYINNRPVGFGSSQNLSGERLATVLLDTSQYLNSSITITVKGKINLNKVL